MKLKTWRCPLKICNHCGFAAMKAKHFIPTWRSTSSFFLAAGILLSREALPVLTPGSSWRALAVSISVKQNVQSHIRHLQAQIPLIVEGTECSKTLGTIKHFTLIFMSKLSFKGKLLVRDAMGKALIGSSCWTDCNKQWVNEFSLWFLCPVCRGDFFIVSELSVGGDSCKVEWRRTICAKCAGRS